MQNLVHLVTVRILTEMMCLSEITRIGSTILKLQLLELAKRYIYFRLFLKGTQLNLIRKLVHRI